MSYSTKSEISYIKNIGKHAELLKHFSRLELLERYQYALNLRSDWQGMDKAKVSNAVKVEIENEVNGE